MSEVSGSKKTIVAAAAVALVLIGAGGFWELKHKPAPTKPSASQVVTETPTQKTEYVTYSGVEGKTALELLKGQANVKTKSSTYGEFVESINDNDGGGKKYWTFFVDGKESAVGAGTYVTKNSEKIEWKLQ